MAAISTLRFPDQEVIIEYLAGHPMTKNLPLIDWKIRESVARFFANQNKDSLEVERDVWLCLYLSNDKLILSQSSKAVSEGLISALEDCAGEKKLEIEKKEVKETKEAKSTEQETNLSEAELEALVQTTKYWQKYSVFW